MEYGLGYRRDFENFAGLQATAKPLAYRIWQMGKTADHL